MKNKWLQANCDATKVETCSAAPTGNTFATSRTTNPFSSHSFSSPLQETKEGRDQHSTSAPSHSTPKMHHNTTNSSLTDSHTAPPRTNDPPAHNSTKPPEGKQPVSLPVIYVILIVASSLSFILVVSGEILVLKIVFLCLVFVAGSKM